MSEDFTSPKVVVRYVLACIVFTGVLVRLAIESSPPAKPSQEERASQERILQEALTTTDSLTATADAAPAGTRVLGDTAAAPNPFDKTQYIVQPGAVEEDDAPAGVKEVEQRHAREDAAGQQRTYAPGLAE